MKLHKKNVSEDHHELKIQLKNIQFFTIFD